MSDVATRWFTARLRFATVKTDDVERNVRFYEEVLGFPRTRTAEDFVQLDVGGAELCIDLDDGGPHQPRLIFAVDDLEAICARFHQMGVEIIAGGPDETWVMVRDADGNEVAFER